MSRIPEAVEFAGAIDVAESCRRQRYGPARLRGQPALQSPLTSSDAAVQRGPSLGVTGIHPQQGLLLPAVVGQMDCGRFGGGLRQQRAQAGQGQMGHVHWTEQQKLIGMALHQA